MSLQWLVPDDKLCLNFLFDVFSMCLVDFKRSMHSVLTFFRCDYDSLWAETIDKHCTKWNLGCQGMLTC